MTEKQADTTNHALRRNPHLFTKNFGRICVFIAGISSLIFVLFAILGTVLDYSPVPVMDMWTGFLDFYLKVIAGDWGAWWSVYVDHRIVLSRIFFWLDLRFFGGGGWFSLSITYLVVFCVAAIFACIWHEQTRFRQFGDLAAVDAQPRSPADWCVLFFVTAWIFSWSQSQNLTFAFQNEFIFAQFLPLAALYFMHRSATIPEKTRRYFWIAVLFGVLAIGSMANGMLALPVIALYALAIRMSIWRIMLLAVFSIFGILLYFYNFSDATWSGGTPGLVWHVLDHKASAITYVLIYLGSPFTYLLTSYSTIGLMANIHPVPEVLWVVEFLAIVLIGLTIWSIGKAFTAPRQSTLSLALTLFIFYVILGASVTAAGRLGFQAAYTSRYVTPALYAWGAALLLVWPRLRRQVRYRNLFVGLLGALFYCLMLPFQVQALASQRLTAVDREMAAMALELQVNDPSQIRSIGPAFLDAPQIALAARTRHLSVFGMKPVKDAHLLFGQEMKAKATAPCVGNLDSVVTLPDPNYLRATGWLFNSRTVRGPAAIYVVDASNDIVGVGLIGFIRGDVAGALGEKAKYTGFQVYLLAKDRGQKFRVISPSESCVLSPGA